METRSAARRADAPESSVPTKCPLTAALNAIGGKWSLICFYWLDSGTRRFNELRRLMPEISHKVLAATLRNLEQEGLISRTVYAEVPPRVEYSMSSHGKTLRPLIEGVRAWGREHLQWKQLEEDRLASPQASQIQQKGREDIGS
jgi:DNA-binding HxlR family transcriptional regulator